MQRATARPRRLRPTLLCLTVCLLVAGCGGGGGDAESTAERSSDRREALVVYQGYLDALVSRNGDAACSMFSPERREDGECYEVFDRVLSMLPEDEIEEVKVLRSRLGVDDVRIRGNYATLAPGEENAWSNLALARVNGAWYVTFTD